jgi:transcriptional regulator with XRE-family HTH domain
MLRHVPFHVWLRNRRESAGLTVAAAAQRAGLSPQTVRLHESGTAQRLPTDLVGWSFREAYGIDVATYDAFAGRWSETRSRRAARRR